MKKLFVSVLLLSSLVSFSQTKKTTTKKTTTATPAPAAGSLKSLSDSASYAIGVSVANFYKQQGMTSLNAAIVSRAINDVFSKKTPLLTESDANNAMMKFMGQAQQSKAKPNIEAGEKFLASNKTKPNVKTTPSGLEYEVLVQGNGPKPTLTDTVVCNYAGTLLNGTEFDNSYKRGEPITFPVTGVIKGWTEALQLMPVGSKYRLWIPQQLAYGTNEAGPIPPGSVLVFDVELLSIKGK